MARILHMDLTYLLKVRKCRLAGAEPAPRLIHAQERLIHRDDPITGILDRVNLRITDKPNII